MLLGLLTSGTAQFVASMAAIAGALLWWTRVSSPPPTAERARVPAWAWVAIPLAVMLAGLATLPLLGYASIGVANAVLVASITVASRH